MISKITKGGYFKGLMNYLTKENKKHEVVDDSMGGLSPKEQLAILVMTADVRKGLKKKVFHGSISLEPGAELKMEQWKQVANQYMEHMGFSNCPYVAIKHNDKPDCNHIHIMASRVDYDGKTVSDSLDMQKSMDFMREVEKKYELRLLVNPTLYLDSSKKRLKSKEQRAAKRLAKRGEKLDKIKIKEVIRFAINEAKGESKVEFNQSFHEIMKVNGLRLNLHKHKKSGKVYGVSYEFKGRIYKASSLGKLYQYNNLNASLLERWNKVDHLNTAKLKRSSSDKSIRSGTYKKMALALRNSHSDYDSEQEEWELKRKRKKREMNR